MSWIATVDYEEADEALRRRYDRVRDAGGQIDNILRAHSLRPHTLDGHMALYKAVLHHSGNRLAPWMLEAIGVHVSRLNNCSYCVDHHEAGLAGLLDDDARAAKLLQALREGPLDDGFNAREIAMLRYAEQLTREPARLDESHIGALRSAGCDDGEILEINQVAAYFAYANRTVLGLGVRSDGERLGLAPRDEQSWQHR